jgi:predicted PurR-regulated permease PerM
LAEPGNFTAAETRKLTQRQTRAALVAVLLLVLAGLWTLHPFLPALGWGVVFAVSLWPWYERLCRRWPRHTRLLLPGLVTFLIVLAFLLPLTLVVIGIARDSEAMLQWLEQLRQQGIAPPELLQHLPAGSHLAAWWQAKLGSPDAIGHLSQTTDGRGLPIDAGKRVLSEVVRRLLLIAFMLLALFFLLRDGERVAEGLRIGSRRGFGPAGERVGRQIVQAIRGTVNGLLVVGFGEAVILGVAYAVAGVPHPALFGLLTGLLSAVPFGAVLAYAAAAALLASGGDIGAGVAIAVLGSVVVFVADHFVRPVLIGGATRLPFVWVLLGILGGIEAWGLLGLVLGPALMAALMLLWREWIGAQPGPLNPPASAD